MEVVPKVSAGVLVWRRTERGRLEFLLAHPGGPLWARRDEGAWMIPKGMVEPGEEPRDAALREFTEETGWTVDPATLVPLGEIQQRAGKIVHAWATCGDFDVSTLRSNETEIEFPPRSGRRIVVPEIDRAAYFDSTTARRKILPSQSTFVDRLEAALRGDP